VPWSFTRRTLLQGIGSGAAGLLLEQYLPSANALATQASGPAVLALTITAVSDNILRVNVAAAGEPIGQLYGDGSLAPRVWPEPDIRAFAGGSRQTAHWGSRALDVQTDPLRIAVRTQGGGLLQELRFDQSPAQLQFLCGDGPIYGLGEGAHALDRRDTVDAMKNGQVGDDLKIYGAHLPIPWLMGSNGWGLFVHEPHGTFNIGSASGIFKPNESAREFTAELFLRWFQFSAFCPLFRGHGRTWKLRLPWGWNTGDYGPAELTPAFSLDDLPRPEDLHNPVVEKICRKYLNTRYQLLPYIYSAVAETHATGMPLMRGLWLHFPEDEKVRAMADEYMFGPALLIAPVLSAGATTRTGYLPAGSWWNFWTNEQITGGKTVEVSAPLETIPVFVRAGTTLATGPVKQFANQDSDVPTSLTVYPGANGISALYEDDGHSFAFERGDFSSTELRWDDTARTLVLRSTGGRRQPTRQFAAGLAGTPLRKISYDGKITTVHLR
jgi:alpha-glucosidase (family GH31 glycosyl hydrolase)